VNRFKLKRQFKRLADIQNGLPAVIIVLAVATIGVYFIVGSHATTPYVSTSANNGSKMNGACTVSDPNAAGGVAVDFKGGSCSTNTSCPQFLEAPSTSQAFCDTFGTASTVDGTRNNALGSVWGFSQLGGSDNDGQNLYNNVADATLYDSCNNGPSGLLVHPEDSATDPGNEMVICNGELDEAQYDSASQSIMAWYPRQPFNFANTTTSNPGDIEVNVTADSAGSHSAWPDITIANTPTPAPFDSSVADGANYNQYSEGADLFTGAGGTCVSAQIFETNNYVESVPAQTSSNDTTPGHCAIGSTGPGNLNHVELVVTPTSMQVYASSAGTTSPMYLITSATFNTPLPNDQGLVWEEDEHYNANKYSATNCSTGGENGNTPPGATSDLGEGNLATGGVYLECQGDHTFGWNDFAFNGPVEPRDLGFDVLNNPAAGPKAINGQPSQNIAYEVGGNAFKWTSPQISASDISNAEAANTADESSSCLWLMTYNYEANTPESANQITLNVNGTVVPFGTASTYATPTAIGQGDGYLYDNGTIPLPFNCNLLNSNAGGNSISVSSTLSEGGGLDISNMDLILKGAGGIVQP